MSSFWHWYICAIALGSIFGCAYILHRTRNMPAPADPEETTGHTFDGIEEYNKPLPLWWLWKFYASIVFALIYLALYPGLGTWEGLLKWTSVGELEEDQAAAAKKYDPIFAKFAAMSVEQLNQDPKAVAMGRRLFGNNCALCHGTDARGGHGFPDLTDSDWLYGGDFETIKTTLHKGRSGQMPAWSRVLKNEQITGLVNYVLKISGNEHDAGMAAAGEAIFQQRCTVCHGKDARGGYDFGAPNLTDNIWLYRQRGNKLADDLYFTLRNGRSGEMPSWDTILGDDKIHILSAYVYGLSRQ